jgi:hypothetical protein
VFLGEGKPHRGALIFPTLIVLLLCTQGARGSPAQSLVGVCICYKSLFNLGSGSSVSGVAVCGRLLGPYTSDLDCHTRGADECTDWCAEQQRKLFTEKGSDQGLIGRLTCMPGNQVPQPQPEGRGAPLPGWRDPLTILNSVRIETGRLALWLTFQAAVHVIESFDGSLRPHPGGARAFSFRVSNEALLRGASRSGPVLTTTEFALLLGRFLWIAAPMLLLVQAEEDVPGPAGLDTVRCRAETEHAYACTAPGVGRFRYRMGADAVEITVSPVPKTEG